MDLELVATLLLDLALMDRAGYEALYAALAEGGDELAVVGVLDEHPLAREVVTGHLAWLEAYRVKVQAGEVDGDYLRRPLYACATRGCPVRWRRRTRTQPTPDCPEHRTRLISR
ncbi:MAG: hypothetical protein ACKVWR_00685 [Acidimicrobiales bacterium]